MKLIDKSINENQSLYSFEYNIVPIKATMANKGIKATSLLSLKSP